MSQVGSTCPIYTSHVRLCAFGASVMQFWGFVDKVMPFRGLFYSFLGFPLCQTGVLLMPRQLVCRLRLLVIPFSSYCYAILWFS